MARTESMREADRRYRNRHKNEPSYKLRRKEIYDRWALKYPLRAYICKRLSLIKQRCINPNYKDFPRYGGNGIKCFLTWKQLFFLWKRDKASSMKDPSIDRKNPLGNYELSNCRFIERAENVSRAHRGIKHSSDHKHIK